MGRLWAILQSMGRILWAICQLAAHKSVRNALVAGSSQREQARGFGVGLQKFQN